MNTDTIYTFKSSGLYVYYKDWSRPNFKSKLQRQKEQKEQKEQKRKEESNEFTRRIDNIIRDINDFIQNNNKLTSKVNEG